MPFLPKANKHNWTISILISVHGNVKQLILCQNYMLTSTTLFVRLGTNRDHFVRLQIDPFYKKPGDHALFSVLISRNQLGK